MGGKHRALNPNKKAFREYRFTPRVINPVKVGEVVIFSADEQVRKAGDVLAENMPWITVHILSDPLSVSNYKTDKPLVMIFDDTALTLVDREKIHQNNRDVVLVLLSTNEFIHCSAPSIAADRFPYTLKADLIFAINRVEFVPEKLITSVVRCAEDRLNIEKYSKVRRYIFLVVDDEPRWFSQFLPVLYNIIGQRADVMVTRTYEETLKFIFGVEREDEIDTSDYLTSGHGDDVICAITDIFFPKGGDLREDAGSELVKIVNKYYPRIPIIIASKAKEADDLKKLSFIMPKGDPGSLQTLDEYIHDFTGLGDFVLEREGRERVRMRNIRELYSVLQEAEKDTKEAEELRKLLALYGRRDFFSTWLYMHGFRELGDKLRPKRAEGRPMVSLLKEYFQREIERLDYTPLVIDGAKVFDLDDLLKLLRSIDPVKIQYFSDNDVFSTWLDRKGYPEIAGEFRPIHGSGPKLGKTLADIVEKWIKIYKKKGSNI